MNPFLKNPLPKSALAVVFLLASPAFAAQQLIPAPYPGQLGGNAQESMPAAPSGGHQQLMPEPAPQANGPAAQGDPQTLQRSSHQHLRPHPYRRQTWCNGARRCSILR